MKTISLFKQLFIAAVLLSGSTTFVSCKKTTPVTPVSVTSCFLDSYNGTYTGSGSSPGSGAFVNSPVTITKLSCVSVKIESPKFSAITVNSLNASAAGGYSGTAASGTAISLSFNGNSVSIGGNDLSFNGTK